MESFQVKVLGTASATPSKKRNQSAHVVKIRERLFLIDCGEGTQMQMMRFGVSIVKIESIFITHIHGDHIFGLFGLFSTMSMLGRIPPLDVYAPSNFGPILKFFFSYFGEGISYEIRFHAVDCKEPTVIYETKSFEVLAFPLNHKIATFGYMFREKEPMFNVHKELIEKYGLTLTEIGTLKRGEDVVREDMVIPASEAAYKPFVPRSYAYVSDTTPFPQLKEWVKGVNLLYHEATFLSAVKDAPTKWFHSNAIQAAECARDAGVGKLLIGHFSSRCHDGSLYEAEARTIFPESYAPEDGDVFDVE